MTLHFPDTEAAPSTYTSPVDTNVDHRETIVPIYARKPPKRSTKKKLLWAIPAVLALGVTAWALTAGEQSREDTTTVAEADADSLTTSRLSQMETASEPSAVSATPLADTPPPAPVVAAPKADLRPTPAARTTPTTTARRAPARSTPAPAPAARARPLPQDTITPVAPEPAPAPLVIVPTLPADPPAQAVPPTTSTPPGGF